VWGIAPDTIRELTLVLACGGRLGVPIVDGAFSVTTDESPRALAWTAANGTAGGVRAPELAGPER